MQESASPNWNDLWHFLLITSLLFGGLYLSILYARRGAFLPAFASALATPFIANAILCLIAFHSRAPAPGYMLTACLVPIFAAAVFLPLLPERRNSRPHGTWRGSGSIVRRLSYLVIASVLFAAAVLAAWCRAQWRQDALVWGRRGSSGVILQSSSAGLTFTAIATDFPFAQPPQWLSADASHWLYFAYAPQDWQTTPLGFAVWSGQVFVLPDSRPPHRMWFYSGTEPAVGDARLLASGGGSPGRAAFIPFWLLASTSVILPLSRVVVWVARRVQVRHSTDSSRDNAVSKHRRRPLDLRPRVLARRGRRVVSVPHGSFWTRLWPRVP